MPVIQLYTNARIIKLLTEEETLRRNRLTEMALNNALDTEHMVSKFGFNILHSLIVVRTARRIHQALQVAVNTMVNETKLGNLNGINVSIEIKLPRNGNVYNFTKTNDRNLIACV